MATTMLTHTRMVFGYDNYFNPTTVNAVTLVNCSAASGSSVSNLEHEDPWLTLRTTAPTANPEIIIDCAGNPFTSNHVMLGLVNQNVWKNYDLAIVYWGTAPSTWTEVGRVDLATSAAAAVILSGNNPDFLMELPVISTPNALRIQFQRASGWPAIEIGNILLMKKHEVTVNPLVDAFGVRYQRVIPMSESIGGALHVSRGRMHRRSTHSYKWERIGDVQSQQLYDLFHVYGDRLTGIIPPNQAGKVLPYGGNHLFGRIPDCHVEPRQGLTATSHLNDTLLQFVNGW